jgi:hypothetical protein
MAVRRTVRWLARIILRGCRRSGGESRSGGDKTK